MEKVQLEVEIKGGDSVQSASGKVENLKTKLRELKDQLASGNLSTEEFNKLSQQAGELQDRIGDVNQRVKNLASDTKVLDGFVSVAQGIAGGFAAAQGAIALFGDENKDLQKQLVKIQGSVALLNGFQQVANTLNKDSAAITLLQSARLKILTFIQTRYTAAVGGTTGALKLLRIAGAALGIGLIIAGIAALIANFDKLKNTVTKFLPSLDTLGKLFTKAKNAVLDFVGASSEAERAIEKLGKVVEGKNKQTEDEIKLLEALGNKEAEIYAKRDLMIARNITQLNRERLAKIVNEEEYQKRLKELNLEKQLLDINETNRLKKQDEERAADRKKSIDAANKAEQERVDAVIKREEALYKKQQDMLLINGMTEDEYRDAQLQKEIDAENEKRKREQEELKWQQEKTAILKAESDKRLQETQAYNDAVLESENQLQAAKRGLLQAGFDLAGEFASKNKTLADVLFAVQKGAAIAQIVVDTQKEIAGYYSNPTWSALPDGGITIKTAYAAGAKIRAATGIAAIASASVGRFMGGGSPSSGSSGGSGATAPSIKGFNTGSFERPQTGKTDQLKVYVTETDIRNVSRRTSNIYSQATVE